MAWLKVKSNVTGQIDTVTDTAYENYFKSMGIYTIIEDNDKKDKKPQIVEEKPIQEDASVKPIKPIRPLKAKADVNDISEEV